MPSDQLTFDRSVCAGFADGFAAAGESPTLSPAASSHAQQCLRCQAEIVNYRRMRRALRGLATEPTVVDPLFEHEILLALDIADGKGGSRVPAIAAAAIGGLAAAAGVIVAWSARHRRVVRFAT